MKEMYYEAKTEDGLRHSKHDTFEAAAKEIRDCRKSAEVQAQELRDEAREIEEYAAGLYIKRPRND